MPENTISFHLRLSKSEYEQLKKLAVKCNVTASSLARQLIEKGMSVDAYQNDEKIILSNMKSALREVLDPQIERMVKINVKTSVSTSINLLYTAFLMHRMSMDESRPKLEVIMDEARHLGILFVKQAKGSIDEFVKGAVKKIEATWADM